MYTGNTSYADAYWNTLGNVLDSYYPTYVDNSSQLLVKNPDMGYGDYAFLPRSGPITYYNALYIHALSYAAALAANLGRGDDADRWRRRADSLRSALLKHNFDNRVGAFYDGGPCPNQPAGTYCNVHAQDGNSLAVLAGVTDVNVSMGILDYWTKSASRPYGNAFYDNNVLSDGFQDRVYAFISYFELSARFKTPGADMSAFEELRRLYGWMASHDPQITMWEGIGPNGSPYEGGFTSMAHGWSTGIVPLMSNYVLGVKPVEPGFARWQICPVTTGGGLLWARGAVPTPHGRIEVEWLKNSSSNSGQAAYLTLRFEAPHGTNGIVCLPENELDGRVLRFDGQLVSPRKESEKNNTVSGDDEAVTKITRPEKAFAIHVRGGASHTITIE